MVVTVDRRTLAYLQRGDPHRFPIFLHVAQRRQKPANRGYGINKGADDYLPKPFSPAELVVRVKSILRRTGPATR